MVEKTITLSFKYEVSDGWYICINSVYLQRYFLNFLNLHQHCKM